LTNNKARAFTLIEVLAALAILAISLVVLVKSQAQSIGNVRRVSIYEKAVIVTENQLYWTYIDLAQAENWEEYRTDTFEDKGFKFTITLDQADTDKSADFDATLLKVKVVTTWKEGRGEGFFELETWYLWGKTQ